MFEAISQSNQLKAPLDQLFSQRVALGKAPASCFAVFDASGLVYENGFGQAVANGSAPGHDTRFRIASCSKSFTAAAVLLLRDRGLISLDDPVTRHVPQLHLPWPEQFCAAPSLRMLLSMAGGLPTDDPWADRQESLSNTDFDAVLQRGVQFSTLPGTRFEYSNLGYALLGRVIEVVSGQTYVDFVSENLLQQLGLHETGFDPALVNPAVMATGYRRKADEWQALPFSGPGAFSAIGGIVTTARDLARWAAWLCSAFREDGHYDGPISMTSRREMQQIHCVIPPDPGEAAMIKGYGYGLIIEQDARFGPIISHSGGYPGFSSHMRWSAHAGIGVIGFENATYSGAWEPVSAALAQILPHVLPAAGTSRHVLPAEIAPLIDGVKAMIVAGWDNNIAGAIFLENVAMDRPYAERAAELSALRAKAGRPDVDAMQVVPDDREARLNGYGRCSLRIPCDGGELVAKIHCGPPLPLRIQTIGFELIPLAQTQPI